VCSSDLADFSIEDLKLVSISDAKQTFLVQFAIQVQTQDNKTTKKFLNLDDQSDGTLVFLALISHLIVLTDTKRSSISIIDELEESLHPKLTRAVVRLLNETAAQKKNGGQLLFSTHDTRLMDDDLLRPDQIYFIEKNKGSNTSRLYRATDFKKIDWNEDKYKGKVKILYEHDSLGASPRIYGLNLEEEEWA
jgi:AAA15 family ATPase/GTPase